MGATALPPSPRLLKLETQTVRNLQAEMLQNESLLKKDAERSTGAPLVDILVAGQQEGRC